MRSSSLTVEGTDRSGAGLDLDVPEIQQVIGGSVAVSRGTASSVGLTYQGSKELVFGFKCMHLGFVDGALVPVIVRAGSVAMAADQPGAVAEDPILEPFGLLDFAQG